MGGVGVLENNNNKKRKGIKQKMLNIKSERLKEKWQAEYKNKDKEVKKQVRRDKCISMERIAEDTETAAQKQHMKTLYTITKTLSNKKPKRIAAMCDGKWCRK